MKKRTIMDQIELPTSVDELSALARYGAEVNVAVRPRLTKTPIEPGRRHPSFQLSASFTVKVEGWTASFEKTYAKGHEVAPPAAAANGFVIANTRLHRDLKQMWRAGVKCEVEPFVMSKLLPGSDLSGFEPKKPYSLDQFAVLASIGVPVRISMTTHTRELKREQGKAEHELYAVYSIHCLGGQYQIETRHGTFSEDDDQKTRDRVYEVAEHRLEMEQHKLKRVGVEIEAARPVTLRPEFRPRRSERTAAARQTGAPLAASRTGSF